MSPAAQPPGAERRKTARRTPSLDANSREVAEVAAQMALEKIGLGTPEQVDMFKGAMGWFTAKRLQEEAKAAFWRRLSQDVFVDIAKWGVRVFILCFVGWVFWSFATFVSTNSNIVIKPTVIAPASPQPP